MKNLLTKTPSRAGQSPQSNNGSWPENLPMGHVASLTPLAGGRNARVVKALLEDGDVVVLKRYFRHAGDRRDRLRTEYEALHFLWRHGERRIPRPLAVLPGYSLAIYTFVEGIPPGTATNEDMDACAAFLSDIQFLQETAEARAFAPASEAAFSLAEVVDGIRDRRDRLNVADGPLANEVLAFLRGEFDPALALAAARVRTTSGQSWDRELPLERRVLSPSDFGLHNALRGPSGLIFLDFEYFGVDDPAKMLADFVLHPGMPLEASQAQRFTQTLLQHLEEKGWTDLGERLHLALPLFRLKWVLILLNEFLVNDWARRAFSALGETEEAWQHAQALQLKKARRMLAGIHDDG
jgi:hypothetical protein